MRRAHKVVAFVILLAAMGVAVWLSRHQFAPNSEFKQEFHQHSRPKAERPISKVSSAERSAPSPAKMDADWVELLKWIRSVPPPTADEIRARLLATRLAWTSMEPRARAEAIRRLLESGDDLPTGLEFRVGGHGLLAGWPTLRVFLLDILATSDPEVAAATARKILDSTSSPDEFATGLRSLTRKGMSRADDSELLARFGQMLGHQDWQGSRGFAEAFDLARSIGSPEAARQLATWNGNPALKSMAMEEFAADHPQAMLEILDTETTLDATTRANLIARADPSDSKQLASVDAYLRSPDRTREEAENFLQSFPQRSATTGFRLYGATPAPYNYDQIKAGDLAAREQVNTWLADPSLGNYRTDLLSLKQRLTNWIEQND